MNVNSPISGLLSDSNLNHKQIYVAKTVSIPVTHENKYFTSDTTHHKYIKQSI